MSRSFLLHDVGQFVRDQSSALAGRRLILSRSEHDVSSGGVGQRVDRLRRAGRPRIRMDTHVAEVMTETRLHERSGSLVERHPGRTQNLVNDRRNPGDSLNFAVCRVTRFFRVTDAIGPPCFRLGHAHYPLRDSIRF